jgi:hypothetical protein
MSTGISGKLNVEYVCVKVIIYSVTTTAEF